MGFPAAIVAITLTVQPHDYMTSGHCWLSAHTDAIWDFVGPMLFVRMVNSEVWVPQGRDISGRRDFSCPLAPNLQANTCILVHMVMVTVQHPLSCMHAESTAWSAGEDQVPDVPGEEPTVFKGAASKQPVVQQEPSSIAQKGLVTGV
ncbi:hypothetical protein U0070_016531 [Myodes glareolus]|uniref:Uncharacterized protein n=1 Tax=Myodes glareolus TaxID=447135 RepID=A0AAW0HAE5_MYOGA